MKVILIDDERLALNYLEHQLSKIADIHVIGKFIDPIMGKEMILSEDVDAVFMDINLPEMNGLELAQQLLGIKPNLYIVFVTAHDDYAVKAFELNALDYLVKPVRAERLMKSVQRIRQNIGVTPEHSLLGTHSIQMKVFQQVLIESTDRQLIPMNWRTTKARELFLYLLQHRGQLVRKSVLIELLWPEYEPSKVYSQLYTAVYQIRKSLLHFGEHFQISNTTEAYILNLNKVNLDVEEWENSILTGLPITAETIGLYERHMELYIGHYLQEYEYWWAESERQRLMLLWLRTAYQIAQWYCISNQENKAVEMYLVITNRHPQAEEAHYALMRIYATMNQHLSVKRQYRLLTSVLLEEINESPSPYITQWFESWSKENKKQ